jgi:hypothetical protein
LRDQLVMRAVLDCFAVLHDDDVVDLPEGRERAVSSALRGTRATPGSSGRVVGSASPTDHPGGARLRLRLALATRSTPRRPPRLADVATTVAAACGIDRDGLAGEPLLQ